jgi:hypothetical protein
LTLLRSSFKVVSSSSFCLIFKRCRGGICFPRGFFYGSGAMASKPSQQPHTALSEDAIAALYREGVMPVAVLIQKSGLRRSDFYDVLRRKGCAFRKPRSPKPSKRYDTPTPMHLLTPEATRLTREALIARLWKTASAQIAQIETRLVQMDVEETGKTGASPGEGPLRLMAMIVKTLRDLAALDADVGPLSKKEMRDDDGQLAPELLRAELARRLAGLRESR